MAITKLQSESLNLADDYTFTGELSGHMYPAFQARLSSNQILSDAVTAKIQWDTEDFDTGSAYDNATNYRFTVPSGKAGKYFFYSTVSFDASSGGGSGKVNGYSLHLYKNGSSISVTTGYLDQQALDFDMTLNFINDASESDYFEIFIRIDNNDGSTPRIYSGTASVFGAYRIGS